MSTKLFVGGLSFNTDNDGLRRGFEAFGAVAEAIVVNDRDTGRSRGFGFVTFEDKAAATAAIEGMDGKELDGRSVRVSEAKERAPRAPRSFGGGSDFGGGGGGPFGGSNGGKPKKGKSRRSDRSERW